VATPIDAKATRSDDAAGSGAAEPARRRTRPLVEAAQVLIVGACLGAAAVVLRGVPEPTAIAGYDAATCAAPVSARPDVRWIEQHEARALIDDPNTLFVDARPREAYERGHVLGALSLPMTTGVVDERALAIVRGARTVITYCDTSGDCASSKRLAGLLAEAGLPDVRVLRGGFPLWMENEYPAEAGPGPARTPPSQALSPGGNL
jgi:rhodanese-related sulfurtransferase